MAGQSSSKGQSSSDGALRRLWALGLVLVLLVGFAVGGPATSAGAQAETTGADGGEEPATDEVRQLIERVGAALAVQPWYLAEGAAEDPVAIAEVQARLTTASGQVWAIVSLDSVNERMNTPSLAEELLGAAREAGTPVDTLVLLTPVDFAAASFRAFEDDALQAAMTASQDTMNTNVVTGIEMLYTELTGSAPPPPAEPPKPNNIARYLAIGAVVLAALFVGAVLIRRRSPGDPPVTPRASGPRLVGQHQSPR